MACRAAQRSERGSKSRGTTRGCTKYIGEDRGRWLAAVDVLLVATRLGQEMVKRDGDADVAAHIKSPGRVSCDLRARHDPKVEKLADTGAYSCLWTWPCVGRCGILPSLLPGSRSMPRIVGSRPNQVFLGIFIGAFAQRGDDRDDGPHRSEEPLSDGKRRAGESGHCHPKVPLALTLRVGRDRCARSASSRSQIGRGPRRSCRSSRTPMSLGVSMGGRSLHAVRPPDTPWRAHRKARDLTHLFGASYRSAQLPQARDERRALRLSTPTGAWRSYLDRRASTTTEHRKALDLEDDG